MLGQSEFPNFKLKRYSKSPMHLRSLCSKEGKKHLEKCLTVLQTAPCSRIPTPSSQFSRPTTAGRIMSKSGKKKKMERKTSQKLQETSQHFITLDYENFPMPIEFIVMDQFRKGIIKEIEKNNPDLTAEKLKEIRCNSVQKELIDIDQFKESKQKQKRKRELLSRNHLTNAAYLIRTLPSTAKATVAKGLRFSLPSATRFHNFV